MAIDYNGLMSYPFKDRQDSFTARDTMLYALAVGVGFEPQDERQLRYVFERHLVPMPTMPVTRAACEPWLHLPESGINWKQMLHGEQELVLHAPFPASGTIAGETCLEEIVDKGASNGALLYMSRKIRDVATGTLLATSSQTLFCRADGGFGGKVTKTRPVYSLPSRAPDVVCDLATSPQAALLYRLTGDVNPLHADPGIARVAGFPRPILHGLCTFGIAAHAILRSIADYQPGAIGAIKARFAAPVFPGETIQTQMWREAGDKVGFRCLSVERDLVVVNNGCATLV